MKLAAGVLALLVYPLAVLALVPDRQSEVYIVAMLAPGVIGLGVGMMLAASIQRPRSVDQPVDERAVDRRNNGLALFFALAVASLALLAGATEPIYVPAICAFAILWTLMWLPVPMRRITVDTMVQIECSPSTAFTFVSDERNDPKYIPEVEAVEKITDGDIGPGTRFRVRMHSNGGVFEGVDEIVDYEYPRRYTDRVVSGRRPNLGTLTFDAEQGGTRLSYRYRSEVSYAGALAGQALLRGRIAADMRTRRNIIWARLKQVLESGATAPV